MARVNIILTFTFLFLVVETAQETKYGKIRIVIRSKEMYLNGIKQSLGKYFFSFDSKINDNLFIFVKESEITKHRLLSSDLQKLRRSNRHIENLAQSYRLSPASPLIPQSATNDSDEQQADQWNASNIMLLCPPYFDQALGIDDSWIKHNVSGRGIVVGVTDVGINANNAFIRESINSDLSYNFVDNIPQTGYTSLPDKNGSLLTTGHAIACAGLIARPNTGDKCVPCGLGVAHGAKVADLQIAKNGERTWLTQGIDSAIFLRALAFRRDAIPIFSNSWATPRALRKSDFYEEEVLTQGIREGRHGLGTIYVFPAGQPGSGLANHIGSITVACLGVNGTVADISAVNAATLVSVFCNGRKRKDQRMISIGKDKKRCETSFGGESAATEIVSGMIALLLEANPGLSARDVKHILIDSSSHLGIEATSEFLHNKAGKYYHPNVGFGLPDCNQMVVLGRHWKQLKPLCTGTLMFSKDDYHAKDQDWYVRVLYDNTFCDTVACIEKMEEVLFEVEFVYSEQHHMKLWAKSPSGTESTLANMKPFSNRGKARHVRNTFRSNHFWGENSEGRWHVYIGCNFSAAYPFPADDCHVANARLVMHGTMESGSIQQHCNEDTYQELDVDNSTFGIHIENNNININNIEKHDVIINNNFSFVLIIVIGCAISVALIAVIVLSKKKRLFPHVPHFDNV